MIVYAVDDEVAALRFLGKAIVKAAPDAELKTFSEPEDLLDAAKEQPCDVAFLDIHMSRMTGLELARTLMEQGWATNVVFVTGYDQHARDAYDLFASGYVMKPVTPEAIADQLKHLRVPVERKEHKIAVKTFGNFDIFVDGAPVHFTRKKSKEILAYLVDKRGTGATTLEIASVLWDDEEDDTKKSRYVNVLVNCLRSDLDAVGAGEVVLRLGGETSVDVNAFECDLYELLKSAEGEHAPYTGQYMNRYSWAETTKAFLDLNY